ncbi:hypothetical protein ACFYL6_18545 [Micromonospora sp. NPDC007208]|uniref:hypothetical protein n=1 Tax=Micromonospora sp. NPDC007208 TaxID=3364236 RepID=UPI00367FFBB9
MVARPLGTPLERPVPARRWSERADGLSNLPGSIDGWPATLESLLAAISRGITADEPVNWPDESSRTPVAAAVKSITRIGLFVKVGNRFELTEYGQAWLKDPDPSYLVEVLHRHVRFLGELLAALALKPLSHEQLAELARTEYGFHWTSLTPVRSRTNWLRAFGAVDLFDNAAHITEFGRQVLARLTLGKPENCDLNSVVALPKAPRVIEVLLEQLDEQALKERSWASTLYIPGSSDDRVQNLRIILGAALSEVSDQTFAEATSSTFGIKADSVRSVFDCLSGAGLLGRVSSKTVRVTDAAKAWLDTESVVDLARILHANIWYFAEIVTDLSTRSCPPTSTALSARSTAYAPKDGRPLTRNAINGRLGLLRACGLIDTSSSTSYRATPLGLAFVQSVPTLRPVEEQKPESVASRPIRAEESADDAETVASELVAAAKKSADPRRFEELVVRALAYLGFPCRHIGGNDNPDGELLTAIGVHGRVMAVEAKTAASGHVSEHNGNILGLPEQRAKISALSTVYVGPGFDRRLLEAADEDPKTAVVHASLLAEAVRRQATTPLLLTQLTALIDPSIRSHERRPILVEKWAAQERVAKLERAIVDVLLREADRPIDNDEGWLAIPSLRRELRATAGLLAEPAEIQAILDYLASARIDVVEKRDGVYRTTVSLVTIAQRLEAPAQQWRGLRNPPAG